MRMICGILCLDESSGSGQILDGMIEAMTPRGLAPSVRRHTHGNLNTAVLDFTHSGARPVDQNGWIVTADVRLDVAADNPEQTFVKSLAAHGPDFPDRINGDFAVAMWEQKQKVLWLGRDFIGARPLAWTLRSGKFFAFASLPKGLHEAGLASAAPDPLAHAIRLRQSFFRGSDSGFAEIAYLPAGHSLRFNVEDPAPQIHRAYRPDARAVGRWSGTQDAAARKLRTLLDEAVQRRMPTNRHVACHLSGGLDSSAITALAARAAGQGGGRVTALSMTTAKPIGPKQFDERPLIKALLKQYPDVEHSVVHDLLHKPGQVEDADWPGGVIGGHDDQMMAIAANAGAGFILSGVGGDEGATYNGANLYAALFRTGDVRNLARELRSRARVDGKSLGATIYTRLLKPLLARFPLLERRRLRSPMDEVSGILCFVKPAFRREILDRSMPPILQKNTPMERVTAFSDHHIPSRCTYFSIMAARHGLAVTFPMLDRTVVDFMLSLPLHSFVRDGYSRQPFRQAMQGIIPDEVRLAQVKVGLFDERFIGYAQQKDKLLLSLKMLRESIDAQTTIFDLDAIAAGLHLLPDAAKLDDISHRGRAALAKDTPPWLPLMAVECLIGAYRLSASRRAISIRAFFEQSGSYPQELK